MTFTHKELVFGRIYPEHPQHFFFSGLPHPEIRCDTLVAKGSGDQDVETAISLRLKNM
jgi:hypothetical protein